MRLEPGAAFAVRHVEAVSITDIVRFAGASGDFNPLHHDADTAAAAGFDSIIAMGQFQAALVAAALTDVVGVERVRRYRVRFAGPVRPGDVLEIGGEVSSIDGPLATVVLTASVSGRVVVRADADVYVSEQKE